MMADEFPWENIRAVRVLELLKEAVGLWHWRHTAMMGVLPREHPIKIQGLSLSLIFAPANAHLAPSLPLSEVAAEKFQWCPRRPGNNHPSVHLHLCVWILAHYWPYVQTVLVFLSMWRSCMYMYVVDRPVASVTPSQGYQIPDGRLLHHFASQRGHLMRSNKHFSLSSVISSSKSIIKGKLKACGTHFRAFNNCHSTSKTPNIECESNRVRRQVLCNELNGCLWGRKLGK